MLSRNDKRALSELLQVSLRGNEPYQYVGIYIHMYICYHVMINEPRPNCYKFLCVKMSPLNMRVYLYTYVHILRANEPLKYANVFIYICTHIAYK